MLYLEIILNLPVNQGFTYSYIPPENEKPELVPQIGKRAEIMFGNKKTEGFIINIFDKPTESLHAFFESLTCRNFVLTLILQSLLFLRSIMFFFEFVVLFS